VKSAIKVYAAKDVVDFSRRVYKSAGQNDLRSPFTYHLSGNDLYCADAERRTVWLEYVPEPPLIMFTKNNRDPKILDRAPVVVDNYNYGPYKLLEEAGKNIRELDEYRFLPRVHPDDDDVEAIDLTSRINRGAEDFEITGLILDSPWMFISYKHRYNDERQAFLVKNILNEFAISPYNPFDFTGRGTNIELITAKYNDYTGMGVTIYDYNDLDRSGNPVIKELGWTPDTLMTYPSRIMYNYMVATMAKRFAALNNSTIMAVEYAVIEAREEMSLWMKKDKSAWSRLNNVTGPTLADFL